MKHFGLWFGLLTGALAFSGSAFAGEAVHLSGSSSLVRIAQKIAESQMEQHVDAIVVVRGSDSLPGLKALLDGTTDIAMISSDIPPEIEKRAKAANLTLDVQPVALDGIVPVVHPSNSVSSLTMRQLGAIYQGAVGSWSELGGHDAALTVLVMPANSGTALGWKQAVIGDAIPSAKAETLAQKDIKAKVATDPLALGYLSQGALDSSVKALAIDGVAANSETLRDGRYPIRRQLSLVTTSASTPQARRVVALFLSAEGQAVVAASGLLPVK